MQTEFDLNQHPHTRQNILTGDWVLVSPHRSKRPWQGKVESAGNAHRPPYIHDCYLCPGNKRADGSSNPEYEKPYSFTNDFAALTDDAPAGGINVDDLLVAQSQKGICRVICFSPRHDLTLPELSQKEIGDVIELWVKEYHELTNNPDIKYIQIFENKGEIMGCSNPHPHGQIWAQNSLPLEISKETSRQEEYFKTHGKSLLSAYLEREQQEQKRIIFENDHFSVVVPFWAVWPFETMIISKRQVKNITEFNAEEKLGFADALKRLTTRYDNLFSTSFPYSAGMHQAPVNSGDFPGWHWHMHFYPPLLRSATVKKFMVGYEMLANPQRDITPEYAADQLRNMSEIHYKQ